MTTSDRITLEKISAILTSEGSRREYSVIPEFPISINSDEAIESASDSNKRPKKLDIVWANERPEPKNLTGSLSEWDVKVVFEIEGFDAPPDSMRRHQKHRDDLAAKRIDIPFIIILYSRALHRSASNYGDNPEALNTKIAEQIEAFCKDGITVIDGRSLNQWLTNNPHIGRAAKKPR